MSQEHTKKYTKKMFTVAEDAIIIQCISYYGTNAWSTIASFLPHRTARQIRERYNTYLKPGISSDPWTKDEDRILVEKVHELGTKWKKIAEFIPNRSQNSIKNRWNFHLKKQYSTLEAPPTIAPVQQKPQINDIMYEQPMFDDILLPEEMLIQENDFLFGFEGF